jgi:sigma-B regulation protein RsbU (phosphoserine phosphatase)
MKAGAHDYLMKGNLARLVPAVERELREAGIRAEKRQAEGALRESEQRYRLLWETCPDAVILMDAQGVILFANPAVEGVFGWRPEEMVGQSLNRIQPEELRGAHQAGIDRYLATGEKRLNWRATETFGQRKDGSRITVEVSYSDMLLEGQRRFVGFIRDITERKRTEQAMQETEEQFRVAREIQQSLFPKSAPALRGFEIAGASYPAMATGGDYFDYLPMLQGRLGITVGDVTGHGIGPALLMAETRAYLRLLSRNRENLDDIFMRANRILAEDVGSERYVTLLMARLDPVARTLAYINAGHPAGYVMDATGAIKMQLKRSGPPLGIQPEAVFPIAHEHPLAQGDLVLLLSDGVDEALSPKDEFFGTERVLNYLRANRAKPAWRIVAGLYSEVREFVQDPVDLDDVTLVVVKVLA